jgi:hypothetical protein
MAQAPVNEHQESSADYGDRHKLEGPLGPRTSSAWGGWSLRDRWERTTSSSHREDVLDRLVFCLQLFEPGSYLVLLVLDCATPTRQWNYCPMWDVPPNRGLVAQCGMFPNVLCLVAVVGVAVGCIWQVMLFCCRLYLWQVMLFCCRRVSCVAVCPCSARVSAACACVWLVSQSVLAALYALRLRGLVAQCGMFPPIGD